MLRRDRVRRHRAKQHRAQQHEAKQHEAKQHRAKQPFGGRLHWEESPTPTIRARAKFTGPPFWRKGA
ncbi:hypothetical protein AMR42_05990 [Limnothrix sp. PR1529]|nr:hypothetical protein BCR12_07480 [Limnothrix sp. P13C2]PIB14469.1 hypothetical protein AMR42_05990 [Limnothrix sp. PR1529]